jgi:hypothetical protein
MSSYSSSWSHYFESFTVATMTWLTVNWKYKQKHMAAIQIYHYFTQGHIQCVNILKQQIKHSTLSWQKCNNGFKLPGLVNNTLILNWFIAIAKDNSYPLLKLLFVYSASGFVTERIETLQDRYMNMCLLR